jgi:hypothetical protein
MTTKDNAKLRKKWKRNINIIKRSMCDLLTSRMIYLELINIIKDNSDLQKTPGLFFEWLRDNYIARMTIEVRRLADKDKRSVSLFNLVVDLQKNPEALDRKYFAKKYSKKAKIWGRSDSDYNLFANKKSKNLSKFKLEKDKRKILRHTNRIKDFVDKWIAHYDSNKSSAIKKLPTLEDIHNSLDQLDIIICKYNMLLTGGGMRSCRPSILYDWKKLFHLVWIK